MSRQHRAETSPDHPEGGAADPASATPSAFAPTTGFAPSSGVVLREDLEAELFAGPPPWTVVQAYLSGTPARPEHRAWVEAHAARSRAFAEVLAALRNDQEERREERARLISVRRTDPKF